jgi:hypothetical protein
MKISNRMLTGERVHHPLYQAPATVLGESADGTLLRVEFDHGRNSDGVAIKTIAEFPAEEFQLEKPLAP